MEHASSTFAPQLPVDLIEALHRPFSHLDVQLRPGPIRQKQPEGTWFCQAIPHVPRWAYEARLDLVVPGGWSSSSPSLVVTCDHLTFSAVVQIGPLTHTSYGEVRLPQTPAPDALGNIIASAPDAYAFAFIDACHRFGLGRYLARLERTWVPYNHERQIIALSRATQRAHVVKLYQQADLPLDLPATLVTPTKETCDARSAPPPLHDAPTHEAKATPHSVPQERSLERVRARLRERDLAWVREHCAGKPLQSILRHFHLACLEDIRDEDLVAVINGTHRHKLRQVS